MKNIRVVNVTNARINAVRVTPVKIARKGIRCSAKNASEERTLSRSSARRCLDGDCGASALGPSTGAAVPASDWFTLLL